MTKQIAVLLALLAVSQSQAQLNLSTRGRVGHNEAVLICGFIVGDGYNVLVIRALGPTLNGFNIWEPLDDPNISLYNGNGDLVMLQNSYLESTAPELAFLTEKGLIPADARECALVWQTNQGEHYTAIVRGRFLGAEGIALVEGYFFKQ